MNTHLSGFLWDSNISDGHVSMRVMVNTSTNVLFERTNKSVVERETVVTLYEIRRQLEQFSIQP